jgi:spore germination cell wall hydrolase CwlJ-like protein
MFNTQPEPTEAYNMESALVAIQSIEHEQTIEDVDSDLLAFLGTDQFNARLLSILVHGESNLESDYGQELVAHTVLNRVQSEFFQPTVEQVIYAKSQFCATKLDSWGEYNGNNLRNVLSAIHKRKFGFTNEVESAILYFNNESVDSVWYAERYYLDIVVKVGGHTFYKRSE